MKEEEERRQSRDITQSIESFLQTRPDATWDFAAGPALNKDVVENLTAGTRSRLRQVLAKDLVNQPVKELLGHFQLDQPTRQ